jgi:hypothetical protein
VNYQPVYKAETLKLFITTNKKNKKIFLARFHLEIQDSNTLGKNECKIVLEWQ